jgi:hypothetical protein
MLSAVILGLAVTSASASCRVDYGKWQFGVNSTTAIHLNGSSTCSLRLSPGRTTDVESVAITQKPMHGAATWSGSLIDILIQYQPTPGYKGADEFSYSITGVFVTRQGATTPVGVANVRVSVDIQ